jgi:hypothetical protein
MEINFGDSEASIWPAVTDVFQIVFWICVASVTVLSYIQARKSLFQPIKTELFKVQVAEFKEIMKIFSSDEITLRGRCDFDAMLNANITKMYDDYVKLSLGFIVEDERAYNTKDFPMSIIPIEKLIRVESHIKEDENKESAVKKLEWSEYDYHELRISRKYVDFKKEIEDFTVSPILPTKLISLIEDYMELCHENLILIEKTLNSAVLHMSDYYKTVEDVKRAEFYWIRTNYVRDFKPLKPKAEEIVKYVRDYFDPDGVLTGQLAKRRSWFFKSKARKAKGNG